MKNFVLKLIVSLILIFFGGWLLGEIINLAALLSPPMVTLISCPAGSTAQQNWVQTSYDQPGQKSLRITCVDQNGASVTPLSDAESSAIEWKIFYPAGVVIMAGLVLIWFVWSTIRNRKDKK